MAHMKMYTPYMIIADTREQGIDLAKLDDALMTAKGYYEMIGKIPSSGDKIILRFNIRAFRNSYGLTDLGRMNLIFHGVLVGKATEDGLNLETEMSQQTTSAPRTAADILDNVNPDTERQLDVYDVILAGIEYDG